MANYFVIAGILFATFTHSAMDVDFDNRNLI